MRFSVCTCHGHLCCVCSWWRVVLDEAQMVGTGLSNVAAMAGRLYSQNRWAVTGTPIGPGGLDDIQGLLRVLHHDPFADPAMWRWCIAEPYLTGEKCFQEGDCVGRGWCVQHQFAWSGKQQNAIMIMIIIILVITSTIVLMIILRASQG